MQRPTEKKKNEQNNDLQNTEKRSKEQATPTKNLEENIVNEISFWCNGSIPMIMGTVVGS